MTNLKSWSIRVANLKDENTWKKLDKVLNEIKKLGATVKLDGIDLRSARTNPSKAIAWLDLGEVFIKEIGVSKIINVINKSLKDLEEKSEKVTNPIKRSSKKYKKKFESIPKDPPEIFITEVKDLKF